MRVEDAPFFAVCELFEQLSVLTASIKRANPATEASSYYLTAELKRKIHFSTAQWFSRFSGGSLFQVFRLLVPEEDLKRVYYLKERRLAKFLVQVLGLEGSGRGKILLDWRTDERFGRNQGDLSAIVFDFVQRSEHVTAPTLKISEVNALLDELASNASEATLNKLYRSMTSIECKWMTRIILKQLSLNIEPKFYFYAFHGWMWKVYEMKNDLERACSCIVQMIADGYTCDRLGKDDSFARIASKYFQPELGTCIAVMECGRGKGIDQVAAKLKGRTAYVEIKYDGERVQAHFNAEWPEKLIIFSKSGRNSTVNRIGIKPYLLESFKNVKNGIFEGELLVYNEMKDCIETFGTVQDLGRADIKDRNVLLGRRHFLMILFDCLYLNDSCLLRKPLYERKRLLNCVITPIPKYIQLSPYEVINFKEASASTQLQSLYLDCLAKRQEGLLIKNADSFYIPGNRTEWFKLKRDYIEGFGDTANFAIIGASYGTRSAGVLDTFLVGALNNKREWENSPSLIVPQFVAVFTVSLGLNHSEMDRLQALLSQITTKDVLELSFECTFGRGFKHEVDFWLRQPLVFELLGSGFVRERGHWYYSLRFPRIHRIRKELYFAECVTYAELQEMAQSSLQVASGSEVQELEKSLNSTIKERRVRFAEAENISQNTQMIYRKEDYFFHLALPSKHRSSITKWLEERGIETLWAPEAAGISSRPVICISSSTDTKKLPEGSIEFLVPKEIESLADFIQIDRKHFSLIRR